MLFFFFFPQNVSHYWFGYFLCSWYLPDGFVVFCSLKTFSGRMQKAHCCLCPEAHYFQCKAQWQLVLTPNKDLAGWQCYDLWYKASIQRQGEKNRGKNSCSGFIYVREWGNICVYLSKYITWLCDTPLLIVHLPESVISMQNGSSQTPINNFF